MAASGRGQLFPAHSFHRGARARAIVIACRLRRHFLHERERGHDRGRREVQRSHLFHELDLIPENYVNFTFFLLTASRWDAESRLQVIGTTWQSGRASVTPCPTRLAPSVRKQDLDLNVRMAGKC